MCRYYKVYEDHIKFDTEQAENTKTAERKKTSFSKKLAELLRINQTRIEQNNDETQIMCKIQFRRFLNLLKKTIWKSALSKAIKNVLLCGIFSSKVWRAVWISQLTLKINIKSNSSAKHNSTIFSHRISISVAFSCVSVQGRSYENFVR